jgi:hypothetical protein
VHFANLLEPWVLLRLVAGLVAVVLFGRAAKTSWRVLRRFDVSRSTEGQLALERHAELGASFVRVAAVVQVALLALTMLAGDRLSGSIRGAMCAFGVFHATPWGFRSLCATTTTAVAAGVVAQLYALDARVKSFELVRPLAQASLFLAALAAIDFGLAIGFTLDLDLSVVASCCSVQLDSVASGAAGPAGLGSAARDLSTIGAVASIAVSVLLAWRAARDPRMGLVISAALTAVIALPFALAASVLEVAPHAFEIPQHVCPFCLLRASVLFIGYPLYGAIFVAITSALGAGIGALLARSDGSRAALKGFARERMRREALAWGMALLIGALPVARYAVIARGGSLFH